MTTTAAMLAPGDIIDGRYELVRELGQGGFAKVFEARQMQLQRTVAVKVLNASLDRSEVRFERRFMQEAKIVAQLKHPNVVTIHDFGFAGALRQPYIAMEALDGHDLAAELRRGPMLPSRLVPLMLGVLDALATGHALQIIHKDLKPGNLFLVSPGEPHERLVVLDYGIARWNIDDAEELTAVGDFTGTPEYVAPEYARSQLVTPAVDVYQVALVLIEALTLCRPGAAEHSMGSVMKHVAGRLTIPDVVRSSPLWPLIGRSLSVEPENRPSDAHAFADELRAFGLEELDAHFRLDAPEPDVEPLGTDAALATTLVAHPKARVPVAPSVEPPATRTTTSARTAAIFVAVVMALAAAFLFARDERAASPSPPQPEPKPPIEEVVEPEKDGAPPETTPRAPKAPKPKREFSL